MAELEKSILTFESTRRSALEGEASWSEAFVTHRDKTPAKKEYHYEHFNTNSIYLKHDAQNDRFAHCPSCGHLLTGYAETLCRPDREHFLSKSSPQASPKSKLVRRRLSSLFRPKHITAIEKKVDQPIFCDSCRRHVMMKYVEQKWCVQPFFNRIASSSRRPATSSSYRNMIREHYAKRLPDRSLEISTGSLLTDTESEHFVKSTDYSIRNKIEDDLKQKLLKEYIKHKRKHNRHVYLTSSNSKRSSEELGNLLFNDTKRRFRKLDRRTNKKARCKFNPACYTIKATSSVYISKAKEASVQTELNHKCCHCANKGGPSRTPDYENSNIQLDKNKSKSTDSLKKTLCKCLKIKNSKAAAIGTSDIINDLGSQKGAASEEKEKSKANLRQNKKKKLKKSSTDRNSAARSETTNELISSRTDSNDLSEPDTLKNDLFSGLHRNSSLDTSAESTVRQPANSPNVGFPDSRSSEVQTEEIYSTHEPNTKEQVMFINHPSCIIVKGGHLHLSQDNISRKHSAKTQTGFNKEPNNCADKSCQCDGKDIKNKLQKRPAPAVKFESEHKTLTIQQSKDPRECTCPPDLKCAIKFKTRQSRHVMQTVMIDDSQDRYQQQMLEHYKSRQQADKLIQSVCTHDPPCEMVPSCFKVKYKLDLVNYCVHVPLCARVPMCSLRDGEKSRFEDLSSKQFISLLKDDPGTQVALVARAHGPTLQTPCVAVQTCNAQRKWISAYDQIHQAPPVLPPMSATYPNCAHAACSSNFDGSVLTEKTRFYPNRKLKSSTTCQNRFMKIFSRHKRSP